ncbi:hypothetical protein [Roseibium sp. TrichSKD4]|uniref:hypothetical protein n=1 Tax=Roseibium sp. TrichSKD4 TaxID=744980 RepID=UPI001111BF0A|nr:hypothetical protein [Roseibium sp. TrichSKD4]
MEDQLPLKHRYYFDLITDLQDRLIFALLLDDAKAGHADAPCCGVAEIDLVEVSEAIDIPPGETLRRMKAIAKLIDGVCVEHDNLVLFAMPGAVQMFFSRLYVSRGFIGEAPNLPSVRFRYLPI